MDKTLPNTNAAARASPHLQRHRFTHAQANIGNCLCPRMLPMDKTLLNATAAARASPHLQKYPY